MFHKAMEKAAQLAGRAKSALVTLKNKAGYVVTRVSVGLTCATSTLLTTVYANQPNAGGTEDLLTKIKNMASQAYSLIVKVSSVTAAVVVAFCLFTMMLSKEEKKVNSALDWLKRVIICWVLIFLVSSLFNWIIANLGLDANTTLQINA